MSKTKKPRTVSSPNPNEATINNTGDLRRMLINTISDVRRGRTDWPTARTVAQLSSVVLQSAKLDLEYLKFYDRTTSVNSPKSVSLVDSQKSLS